MTFVMDGVTYNVDITNVQIEGEFLYKYANRTQNGDFQSEGLGYFENQSLTFSGGPSSDFVALYQALTQLQADGTFNHEVELYSPLGKYNFDMYPNRLPISLDKISGTDTWWGEMSVKFTAVSKKV